MKHNSLLILIYSILYLPSAISITSILTDILMIKSSLLIIASILLRSLSNLKSNYCFTFSIEYLFGFPNQFYCTYECRNGNESAINTLHNMKSMSRQGMDKPPKRLTREWQIRVPIGATFNHYTSTVLNIISSVSILNVRTFLSFKHNIVDWGTKSFIVGATISKKRHVYNIDLIANILMK